VDVSNGLRVNAETIAYRPLGGSALQRSDRTNIPLRQFGTARPFAARSCAVDKLVVHVLDVGGPPKMMGRAASFMASATRVGGLVKVGRRRPVHRQAHHPVRLRRVVHPVQTTPAVMSASEWPC